MKNQTIPAKAAVFAAVVLALSLVLMTTAVAGSAQDWLADLYKAYEGLADDQTQAAATPPPAQETTPPASVSGGQAVDMTGIRQVYGDFEFMVSSRYNEAGILKYTGTESELTLPTVLGGYPVTYIGMGAFSFCQSLTGIVFPDTLVGLQQNSLYACTGLTDVYLPDSVEYIQACSFTYCQSMRSIRLPPGITLIDEGVFLNCLSLETIEIPDGVTNIAQYAFAGCSSLGRVSVPASVQEIASDAFLKSPNINLHVYEGSYAHQFAQAQSLPYTVIG
ncbi:MAG: leucine-rich repeat domain-containing protein [Clostridiales bacterium]|nr:leucine-rich repeat domain-containing protein [Clostridiales bacterium]